MSGGVRAWMPVSVIERRTTTEPCPRCARMRPRRVGDCVLATVSWDIVSRAGHRSGRPVRLCCANGHDTDDGASLWMWLGERVF